MSSLLPGASLPIERVLSIDDPRLEPYRNLKATNRTRRSRHFIVEGDKLVERLLASDFEVQSLLVSERFLDQFAATAGDDRPILVVPDAWVEQIVGFNFHRGVLGCASRKPNPDLAFICQQSPRLTIAVCPDAQDPENLGGILRIASALGINAVVLGPNCCDPLSRRVLRVSMGAALRVPTVCSSNLKEDLLSLRESFHVRLAATVTHRDAAAFQELAPGPPIALLFGSEGHGLSSEWIELCDSKITIPMRPGVDSLNVAVAAGILLYHFAR